eukprot:CAMPEP_0114149974 /NCGR_PEP_ID=MMETSP0043_2-20121206/22453_1 /TAXON_ID=464988 /ORGANISM="Hemiselmis andersenii, Strain CCMP644" /LENGTH=54 /DNA_ID=CAMNT_0001244669 /DNA_START=197 /DNA_END=361 /DNA_ORIENTATION=+
MNSGTTFPPGNLAASSYMILVPRGVLENVYAPSRVVSTLPLSDRKLILFGGEKS